jgi:hypothetical protein
VQGAPIAMPVHCRPWNLRNGYRNWRKWQTLSLAAQEAVRQWYAIEERARQWVGLLDRLNTTKARNFKAPNYCGCRRLILNLAIRIGGCPGREDLFILSPIMHRAAKARWRSHVKMKMTKAPRGLHQRCGTCLCSLRQA